MRILHCSSEKTWRGGEQQIANLICELNNLEVESNVFVRRGSAFESWCRKNNLPHYSYSSFAPLDLRTGYQLIRYAMWQKIDLIHLHTSRSHSIGLYSALMGNKIPMVATRRVIFPVRKSFKSNLKYNHPAIKKVICVSENVKEVLVGNAVTDVSHCCTIHDGIDINRFSMAAKSRTRNADANKEFLIGYVAALTEEKDHFTFLQAAALILKHLPAKFLLIGEGELHNDILSHAKTLGIEKHLILTGFVDRIEEVYSQLDVFLFTSTSEGLGSAVLEAMAAGVPVVATSAGGVKEVIVDKVTGMLAPVKDSATLADQVVALLNNTPLKDELVANAKRHVEQFSQTIMAQKVLEVYKAALY